jgi:triosephosphate isomerase
MAIKERLPLSGDYIVAYEPAVGLDVLPQNLSKDVDILRQYMGMTPLLYGGGVTKDTVPYLGGLFDGFLVGRASLDIEKWTSLMDQVMAMGCTRESFVGLDGRRRL